MSEACKVVLTVIATAMLVASSAIFASAQDADLDPSCATLNLAYSNTRATELYGGQLFEIKPDGSYVLVQEYRFRKNSLFRRWAGFEWREERRVNPPLSYKSGSRFTSCQLKAVASKDKGAHFSANWHGNPYRGKVEVWLSPDEFKFGRVFLSYEGDLRPGPHGKQLELFNYDPDNTEFPKP